MNSPCKAFLTNKCEISTDDASIYRHFTYRISWIWRERPYKTGQKKEKGKQIELASGTGQFNKGRLTLYEKTGNWHFKVSHQKMGSYTNIWDHGKRSKT
jgi:hypothetical protein